MKKYSEFISKKTHTSIDKGIETLFIPEKMFDFQKHVLKIANKRGRMAVFLDTGLGKTIIELSIAQNYFLKTNKPVLIITPLAVAFQFEKESKKFGIDSVEYSRNGEIKSNIVICNYEQLDKFDPKDFDCVILDESSILKNSDGKTRLAVTEFLMKVKYRYLFTATPSPNDFIELGTSSEALGFLGYTDMLGRFFTNNEKTIKSHGHIGVKWILKQHAKEGFFKWIRSWSISAKKPSDLGFSDEGYDLPALKLKHHEIKNKTPLVINNQTSMFTMEAKNLSEIRGEQRATIEDRCKKAVELASNHDTTVYWCNLNSEADIIEKLDKDAVQIKGGMTIEKKEEMLLKFANGEIKKLITKPKITSFGLNWQHCNHTVYFPSFSYEQYYQAIRRFWRFGQEKEVIVDMVYSDGQKRIIRALLEKSQKAIELFDKLNKELTKKEVVKKEVGEKILFPKFLTK